MTTNTPTSTEPAVGRAASAARGPRTRGLALALGWPRLRFTLLAAGFFGLVLSLPMTTPTGIVVARALLIGLAVLLAFGLFEQWPRRLPRWLPRWILQLLAVVAIIPFASFLAYWLSYGGDPQLGTDRDRTVGYFMMTFTGVFFAPWMALAAMLRQKDAFAREQAIAFELERSELERQALDARMRLLQAQVEPHFLFNTLANVQALVETGSPQASQVLGSLIAYLRAAVPRLNDPATTLGQEVDLVRAYLELMHMRMPDRLQFALQVDEAALALRCPPMTLLTLVENAVHHGIDPSVEGGRIEVEVRLHQGRCRVRVSDTGGGLRAAGNGPGTGLAALRERLQLSFGGDAQLRLLDNEPRGVRAELEFPARPATA
jgi:signal transduction histidine kinase